MKPTGKKNLCVLNSFLLQIKYSERRKRANCEMASSIINEQLSKVKKRKNDEEEAEKLN